MKERQTGIVRHLDEIGRLVMPKEIRRRLHWASGDPIQFTLYDDGLLLERHQPLGQLRHAKRYTDCFFALTRTPVALCTGSTVVAARGFRVCSGVALSPPLVERIERKEPWLCTEANEAPPLAEGAESRVLALYPMRYRDTVCGALLLGAPAQGPVYDHGLDLCARFLVRLVEAEIEI